MGAFYNSRRGYGGGYGGWQAYRDGQMMRQGYGGYGYDPNGMSAGGIPERYRIPWSPRGREMASRPGVPLPARRGEQQYGRHAGGIQPVSNDAIDARNRVREALDHPDRHASLQLGDTSNFSKEEKDRIAGIAGAAAGQGGGFFTGILDYIVAFFQSLGGDKSMSQIVADRRAMRRASSVHTALSSAGYANLAERISGVQPDGQGGFVPAADSQGQHSGLYSFYNLPQHNRNLQDAAALGRAPTPKQAKHANEVFAEEVRKIYSDTEARKHMLELKGKNGNDSDGSWVANTYAERVADAIINDPKVKESGTFNYGANRESFTRQVREQLRRQHGDNHLKYHQNSDADRAALEDAKRKFDDPAYVTRPAAEPAIPTPAASLPRLESSLSRTT